MPMDAVVFNLKYMGISVLLPIVFLVISSYFVVNRALKFSPVDLIRGGMSHDPCVGDLKVFVSLCLSYKCSVLRQNA
jgi:hypothetical protein